MLRLGGFSGLLAVVSMIPAYLVGYPGAPGSLLEAQTYFDAESGMFVFSNGVLPLFHVFFFLLFLGVLYGLLRSAGGEARGIAGTTCGGARRRDRIRDALGGGVHSRDLLSSGPAALRRTPIRHRFRARIADALLMALPLLPDRGVSHGALHLLVAAGTRVLPGWLALAGFVVALLTLLHFLLPLLAALVGLAWVAVVSAVMLIGGSQGPRTRRTR